jgi:soluble lytic murein transglycosylase-like protein
VTLYDVPLSEELQLHIIQTSEAHDIDPAVVIAVAGVESSYKPAAKGDGGNSLGLMQIQPKWHKERMDRLDCHDLLDPFQNVTVGIDILAGLMSKYDGNISMALMAYNAGSTGANRYWFSKGIYSNDYSKAVLEMAAELETYQAHI